MLGLVPFHFQRISTVADRYLYLAMLGPAVALAWWACRFPLRHVLGVAVAGSVGLGTLSCLQAAYWCDGRTLFHPHPCRQPAARWPDIIWESLPPGPRHHAEAVAHFRAGLAVHGEFPELDVELGSAALFALHKVDEATEVLRKAADRYPQVATVQHNLANILAAKVRPRRP